MLNLYWKFGDKTRNLINKPFETEAQFEKYIFDNQELLGDVFIIHRQVRTGSREGIPDMLGVDQDARICIIEMKNVPVSEDVLPQVLSYAIWAETNPDSIKAIWLESLNKPEDIEIEWDNFEVRVIVIAPDYMPTVPRMAGKIGYPIDLFQVRRFCFEDDEFLLVEVLEEVKPTKAVTTKYKQEWDRSYYESEHGKKATDQFLNAVAGLEKIVTGEGWGLPYNINKYYTGFKFGYRIVFHVAWAGTHVWDVRFTVPKDVAEKQKLKGWVLRRYDEEYKSASFRALEPTVANVQELKSLCEAAYENVAGK